MEGNPDLIEFEEETGSPRLTMGGIVGGIVGALLGYKFAKQTYTTPEPKPLPDNFIIQNGEGPDLIEVSLITGACAAVGYAIGSFFSKVTPRRFKLKHRD